MSTPAEIISYPLQIKSTDRIGFTVIGSRKAREWELFGRHSIRDLSHIWIISVRDSDERGQCGCECGRSLDNVESWAPIFSLMGNSTLSFPRQGRTAIPNRLLHQARSWNHGRICRHIQRGPV